MHLVFPGRELTIRFYIGVLRFHHHDQDKVNNVGVIAESNMLTVPQDGAAHHRVRLLPRLLPLASS